MIFKISNGGPAFPQACACQQNNMGGMTLLDYFAAQMVGAAYSSLWTLESSEMSDSWRDELAQEAYKMAAAMIRAREQG